MRSLVKELSQVIAKSKDEAAKNKPQVSDKETLEKIRSIMEDKWVQCNIWDKMPQVEPIPQLSVQLQNVTTSPRRDDTAVQEKTVDQPAKDEVADFSNEDFIQWCREESTVAKALEKLPLYQNVDFQSLTE